MAHVLAAAVDMPIEWRLATTVVELVLRDGAVAGVVAERCTQREQIDARAVLLATGGFAGNPSLLAKFGPKLSHAGPVLVGGAEQATGRGHELASAAGADLVGLERIWTYAYGVPDPADPSGQRGLALWLTGDIWLNGGGRRFHDESQRGGASATPALLRQPGATSWSIFDAREAGRIEIPHPRYRRDDGSPDRVAIARRRPRRLGRGARAGHRPAAIGLRGDDRRGAVMGGRNRRRPALRPAARHVSPAARASVLCRPLPAAGAQVPRRRPHRPGRAGAASGRLHRRQAVRRG